MEELRMNARPYAAGVDSRIKAVVGQVTLFTHDSKWTFRIKAPQFTRDGGCC
jgi:hypothetical protein